MPLPGRFPTAAGDNGGRRLIFANDPVVRQVVGSCPATATAAAQEFTPETINVVIKGVQEALCTELVGSVVIRGDTNSSWALSLASPLSWVSVKFGSFGPSSQVRIRRAPAPENPLVPWSLEAFTLAEVDGVELYIRYFYVWLTSFDILQDQILTTPNAMRCGFFNDALFEGAGSSARVSA